MPIEEIHELAFGAADMLNNLSNKISPDYKLGYAQGILDAIVKITKPEVAVAKPKQKGES